MDQYDLGPVVAEELLTPTLRPHVEVQKNFIYLILHFPTTVEITGKNSQKKGINVPSRKVQEVDFIIGNDFIITTHYDSIDSLYEFSKIFEVNSIVSKRDMGNHAGHMFFLMIQFLYRDLHNKVEVLSEKLNEMEEEIFAGKERAMVIELSLLNRTLLTFKESIEAHKDVLTAFEVAAENFFGTEFKYHLKSILSEYYKVKTFVESTKEYLNELRETNNSLLHTKQNEVVKTLTVITFIILPLNLIAGIFGMNIDNAPFIGHPLDFVIIISIMAGVGLITFAFCKEKGWL
jgi:magnesium transporter